MTGRTGKKVDIKKNWVKPELKKIDIGQVTAVDTYGSHTEGGNSTEHYS